jgi:hypothetical protein
MGDLGMTWLYRGLLAFALTFAVQGCATSAYDQCVDEQMSTFENDPFYDDSLSEDQYVAIAEGMCEGVE